MKGENVEEDLGSTEKTFKLKGKGRVSYKEGKSREKEENHENQQMGAIERIHSVNVIINKVIYLSIWMH